MIDKHSGTMFGGTLRRWVAVLLALSLCLGMLPASAMAEEPVSGVAALSQGQQPEVLQTTDGEIPVEEDWNEAYPYGTFAFGNHQADLGESGAKTADGAVIPESILIPVYRLGGTTGKVTAWICFAPAITTDETGTVDVYDYAASGRDDIRIEYENPNPIAACQELGVPRWQLEMQAGEAAVVLTDEGEPTQDGVLQASLSGAVRAESFRWQVLEDGVWKDLAEDAEAGASIQVAWSLLWDFEADSWTGTDLRCIYTLQGKSYCAESLLGQVYTPIPAPEALPEQVDLDADPGYSTLEMDEAFDIYEFPLTFADGETVKYIRVTAMDDETAELPELGLFTITACEGGELGGLCNTLTLMVSDNDEHGPSTLGFSTAALTADRAEQGLRIPVRREGDKSYSVTVRYETVDGTAKAGVDYAAASGELAFAGSIDMVEIPVELIANDSTEEKTFTVRLSQVQGGGTEDLCSLTTEEITVTLTGRAAESLDGSGQNLATLLSGADGAEVAGQVTVAEDSLLADNREIHQGHTDMAREPLQEAELAIASDTRSHRVAAKYTFSRDESYSDSYWNDWEILLGTEGGTAGSVSNTSQDLRLSSVTYDGNKDGAHLNSTAQGRRDDIYNGFLTDANWSGTYNFVKNEAIQHAFGNYFYQFKIDVEWKQVGVQDTGLFYDSNRYLLPILSYGILETDGTENKTSYTFHTDGDDDDEWPTNYTIRAYTDGSGFMGTVVHNNNEKAGAWYNVEVDTLSDYKPNSIGMGQDLSSFSLQLKHCYSWQTDGTTSNKELCDWDSHVDIRRFLAKRRWFNQTHNGIDLVIYTANDENEAGGFTALSPSSAIYTRLTPTVSLVSDRSGVNAIGDLYVGSTLQVKVPQYMGFTVPDGGVFLTNSKGTKVGNVTNAGGGIYYIEMMWDGIQASDQDESYAIQVVYDRVQKIQIDVSPSVPRLEDGVTIDPSKIEETWADFAGSPFTGQRTAFAGDVTIPAGSVEGSAFGSGTGFTLDAGSFQGNAALYSTTEQLVNTQEICFHQDPEDVILLNGRAYAGNQTIRLTEEEMAADTLTFLFYDQDYLDAVSTMEVYISNVEVYYDGDGDGQISGSFENGTFLPSSEDFYVDSLSGDYPDSVFKPAKDDETGVIHQYFFKVYYSIRPRALNLPAGASETDRAQILPAFLSAVTEPEAAAELTDEQLSYRWISGANTDDKRMYGAEATAYDYFDIPLGGDVSKVTMDSETVLTYSDPDEDGNVKVIDSQTTTTYSWTPEYVGTLLVPFDNPTPIVDTDNITGGEVALAGENPVLGSDGSYSYSDEGREMMNAFLGSFVGRTTFAAGIQQQRVRTRAAFTAADAMPESITIGNVSSTPSPDNLNNLQGDGDVGSAEGAGPGGDIDQKEFAPDLGTELPNLELELGDYATIIIDGYKIGFSVGLPLYKKENSSYSGSEHTETMSNGSTKTTGVDEDGNAYTKITSADGKKETTKRTVVDPDNPDKRTVTIRTVTTDDNGNKTYRTETREQGKLGNGWVGLTRTVSTDAPETPSDNDNSGGFKEGFNEANSGMATMADFCKAIASRNKTKLKELSKGLFDDDTFNNAKNGNTTTKKVEVSFTVQIAIMFEYNPIDNCHYFKTAGISATLSFEFSVQTRLTPCPIVYLYLKLGVEVEVGVSLSCLRKAVEGDEITDFISGSPDLMAAGAERRLVFKLDMRENGQGARGFHMDLDGKLFMTVFDNPELSGDPLTSGALKGDGGEKEVMFQAYNREIYICLEARGDAWPEISGIKPVLRAESKVVFDGLNITPSLSMEIGAGIGVELMKLEIFFKTSIAITMTMGGYLEDTDRYEGFYISSFEWNMAIGINVTMLFFNFSLDAIAFGVEGAQNGSGGYFTWDITASALSGAEVLWSKTTYTTADAKSLEKPVEAYGVNFFPDEEGVTFYNPDGTRTAADGSQGNAAGWKFRESLSAYSWDGGLYQGEIPLNADLATARLDGASVAFQTDSSKIQIFFDGRISVKNNSTGRIDSYTESPATLELGEGGASLTVSATAGTSIDRYCEPTRSITNRHIRATSDGHSLVHVTAPTDITDSQKVFAPGEKTRAIDPTATSDFQLSGYNTSGDAKKLVAGLTTGYSYKLAECGGNTYLAYPLMRDGVPQLVLSKLVMTGDLNAEDSGLVHPTNPLSSDHYLLLDRDGLMDLDFTLRSSGNKLIVEWVSYADETGSSYSVKKREINMSTGIASQVTVLEKGSDYRFLPAVEGSTLLWATASGDGATENDSLKAWLLAKNEGLTEAMLEDVSVADSSLANPVFFWATQSRLNALNGSSTVLKTGDGRSAPVSGQVQNLETVTLDGEVYVLYTTSEAVYFDTVAAVPSTVSQSEINENTERGTVQRLYLRKLDAAGFGPAMLLQTIVDFDSCSDDTLSTAKLKDGVYVDGALSKAKADPYFANLRFVTADIDGSGVQTLGLFEMGGNSYLIPEAGLKAVAAGSGGAELIPVFAETTGTEVTIGSDGTTLALVFTAPVSDSQSNAIYVAWWDSNIMSWGAPTILAMRNLQIYEDRITYEMDASEAEQAYLGKLTTPGGHTGSPDKLTFSNLQMTARTVEKSDGSTGKQLLVLTEGSFVPLKDFSFNMGDDKEPFEAMVPDGTPSIGFYAIAFGAGEQALGEGNLGFASYDFTIGNELVGEVSFTNTGTVAIRASEANPARIRLSAGGQMISEWLLTNSIASGETMRLTFDSLPLSSSLSAGTKFSLTVQEDPAYFGENAFWAELDNLLTVEEKPELSFGSFEVSLNTIEDDAALLDFYATVLNNGSGDAEQLFLQFSYETGETDESGNRISLPVDITGSSLHTSKQAEIPRSPVAEDYTNGVYALRDENGNTNLDKNYYRSVSGTLRVPASCFMNGEDFSGLHLRAEIFSDADSPDLLYGVYSSEHNEYNQLNNLAEQTLKHQTTFDLPARISTALGTTLTLPVSFASTSPEPDLVLTEISDGTENWSPRMGICYYDPDRQVIVAAPNSTAQAMLEQGQTPTGILQLKDQATNSIAAITYKIGSMADGVNIYRDDASFTFYNPDGTPTDLYAAAVDAPGWLFLDRGVDIGWVGGEPGEIPMNSDLSLANQDCAYFTFDTVADTLTFYFMGEITVSSSIFDEVQTFTQSPATIEFGNEIGMAHTVTVTAQQGTRLDRYVATYKTNPIIDADPDAPQMLWSRSFPETASIETGGSVLMTCYVTDATGIQSVSFNGQTLSETTDPALVKLDDCLWYFDYTFTSNNVYKVRATDLTGNSVRGSVAVDWFNDVLSAGAIGDAPGLQRSDLSFVDASGASVDPTQTVTEIPYLKSGYALQKNETSSAHFFTDGVFSDSALGKLSGERWQAGWNGCYLVRVDRSDGTWARAVIRLENLDLTPPPELPQLEGEGTPDAPYRITSLADWQELARYTNAGNPTSGMYFLQTADVSVTDSEMVGTADSPFMGIYEGGGHTLRFHAEDAPENCAPFGCVENAAFHDLRVEGSITTSQPGAAGFCATVRGSCSFVDCLSAVEIHSDLNGPGAHGGFVGASSADSEITMLGCSFVGALFGTQTTGGACFIGSCGGSASVTDSLAQPTAFEWSDSFAFVCAVGSMEAELRNCYYLGVPNDAQGREAYPVLPGTDVSLSFGSGKEYAVAELTAYGVGLSFDGAYHAGEGETVNLTAAYTGSDPADAETFFLASAGTLTENNAGYALTMPAGEVFISLGAHEWGSPWYEWSEDCSEVTAHAICIHNPLHTVRETVRTSAVVTKPATCEESGETTYTAVFTNHLFAEQVRTRTDVEPLGHDWGEPHYEWAADNSSVTATVTCSRDASHAVTETAATTFVLTQPSTFESTGKGTYQATFENPLFLPQTLEIVIPEVVCEGGDACPSTAFVDMPPVTNYAHIPIDWAVVNKITNGTGPTTFGPKEKCTRAQFVTFLWRVNGQPEPVSNNNPFKDVKRSAYYYKAVLWAVEQGITNGTTATTFSPKDPVTRAQVVTFLWRYEGMQQASVTNPFKDVYEGAYYYDAVLWAVEKKITTGTSENTFSPKRICNRAQCVTFLYREFGQTTD